LRYGRSKRRGFRRWGCAGRPRGVSFSTPQGWPYTPWGWRYRLFRRIAKVDKEKCIGCKTCVERCPFGAVFIDEKKAQVNAPFCRGCGICTLICPKGAISLEYTMYMRKLPDLNRDNPRGET